MASSEAAREHRDDGADDYQPRFDPGQPRDTPPLGQGDADRGGRGHRPTDALLEEHRDPSPRQPHLGPMDAPGDDQRQEADDPPGSEHERCRAGNCPETQGDIEPSPASLAPEDGLDPSPRVRDAFTPGLGGDLLQHRYELKVLMTDGNDPHGGQGFAIELPPD